MAISVAHAYGPTKFYGPYNAEVVRVIDGDTIVVVAEIFPHLDANISVRIEGIDTPELRGKKECEKVLARAAKEFVESKFTIEDNPWVQLVNVKDDKYAGRVVANVFLDHKTSLGALLLINDMAVPYDGKKKTHKWC